MLKHTLIVATLLALSANASANLTFKAGFGYLDPTAKKNLNGDLTNVEVSGEAALLPSIDYRFGNTPFSAELLLATPFEHTVRADVDGNLIGGEIATFKHLPPTLTFKYNTPEFAGGVSANVGIGATVLIPYEEKMADGIAKIEADTVVAPAAQVGISYSPKSSPWGVFADVRYVDLSTDLHDKNRNTKIGELEVNPVIYALGISHKF